MANTNSTGVGGFQTMPVPHGHMPIQNHEVPQTNEKMELAFEFLDKVKLYYQKQPEVYNQFLDIMKDFKNHRYLISFLNVLEMAC